MTDEQLERFVRESWKIEGYENLVPCTVNDIMAVHQEFLQLQVPVRGALENAALMFTRRRGRIRSEHGLDVQVGNHMPPRGGPEVVEELDFLLDMIIREQLTPFEAHFQYETLHPFMDGNGRTGRMLWAWHMMRDGQDGYWPERGFLHTFYYQSLGAIR